jgi:hypothetical protein
MRAILVFGILTAFVIARAAESGGPPVLEGIVNVADPKAPMKVAVLKVSDGYPSHPILREGDRDGRIELKSILPEQGKVVVRDIPSGATLDLYLTQPLAGQEPPTLQFRNAGIASLFDLIQELDNRTILAPGSILNEKFDLVTPTYHNRQEAAAALKDAVKNKNLILEPRSDKFIFVVPPKGEAILESIVDPPAGNAPGEEEFPPGLIKFRDADMLQVLDIYQELSGRTVLRPNNLIRNTISVRSQTTLQRPEAIWTLNALFRLADVVIINETNKFVFAVPPSRTNNLPHIDPKRTLPSKASAEQFPPGLLKFNDADMPQFLDVYANLIGRKAVVTKEFFGKISVRTQTALEFSEALFVFEALASLNNVAFNLSDPEKVSVIAATGSR